MIKQKKFYIEGSGCDRRLLEKAKILHYLNKNHFTFTRWPSRADYILLFTCAFKKAEEDNSLQRLKTLKKYRGKLIICGCLPDIAPHLISGMGAILKLAPKELSKIDNFFDDIETKFSEIEDSNYILEISKTAFAHKFKKNILKIGNFPQYASRVYQQLSGGNKKFYILTCSGCLGRCSYCAIPRAIGSIQSKSLSKITEELKTGLRNGNRDFVLLGDDLGSYGLDGIGNFPILLECLGREIEVFCQNNPQLMITPDSVGIHLKEVHPKHLIRYEAALIRPLKSMNIRSLLIPIQSGSSRILGLMQRDHTIKDARESIKRIKGINPNIELSTQIIVGFPTETEDELEATLFFVKELGFRWVVMFPFDRKIGTAAAQIAHHIPEKIIRERIRKAKKFFRNHHITVLGECPW